MFFQNKKSHIRRSNIQTLTAPGNNKANVIFIVVKKYNKQPMDTWAIIRQSFLVLEVKAKVGDVEAQYQLGEMYFNGFLLGPKRGQAGRWLQLAVKHCHPKAQALLDKVNKKT